MHLEILQWVLGIIVGLGFTFFNRVAAARTAAWYRRHTSFRVPPEGELRVLCVLTGLAMAAVSVAALLEAL